MKHTPRRGRPCTKGKHSSVAASCRIRSGMVHRKETSPSWRKLTASHICPGVEAALPNASFVPSLWNWPSSDVLSRSLLPPLCFSFQSCESASHVPGPRSSLPGAPFIPGSSSFLFPFHLLFLGFLSSCTSAPRRVQNYRGPFGAFI